MSQLHFRGHYKLWKSRLTSDLTFDVTLKRITVGLNGLGQFCEEYRSDNSRVLLIRTVNFKSYKPCGCLQRKLCHRRFYILLPRLHSMNYQMHQNIFQLFPAFVLLCKPS